MKNCLYFSENISDWWKLLPLMFSILISRHTKQRNRKNNRLEMFFPNQTRLLKKYFPIKRMKLMLNSDCNGAGDWDLKRKQS